MTFTWFLFEYITLEKYNPVTKETKTWSLDFLSIAYFCAILTGSDIIAAVTLVKYEDQP